jgi:hypothetical protein
MSEHHPRALPFAVLGVGLMAISFGAILARFAQGYGLPSLAVAALRLGLAALIVTPLWFIALGLGWVFIGKKRMAGVR